MPGRSNDDVADPNRPRPEVTPGHTVDDAPTDQLVESGSRGTEGSEDSSQALAKLGLEARAELDRLRARLGLLDESSESEQEPEQPTAVGRYRLLERIGQGGMGVVYRASDPELGRDVAIKLVHARAFAAPERLRIRLLREAKVLAKLAHPNVVRVYDCGHHEGEVYLAMELVEGKTLREWEAVEEREPGEIVDAYVAAAMGLGAAHQVGIVHRDFKPDNVLVADDGRVLVGDFGLAASGVEEIVQPDGDAELVGRVLPASLTKTGALLGTVLYMSPEQLRGEQATKQSDQFAFCVALWEALTGMRPFESEDRVALLAEIEKGRPMGGERLPGKQRRALQRGLSFDPRDRFAELGELAEVIRRKRGMSAPALVALVGASLGAGLLLYPMVFAPAAVTECGLERAVVQVRDSEAWGGVHERLDGAGVGVGLERLELHLRRLEEQAQALCERSSGPGDEARRQHLQSWVESIGGLLETAEARSMGELLEDIEELEHARLTAPPPRALDENVVVARDESRALERGGDLPAALQAAERAVELAGERSLELAVAQQRRGRVLTLLGKHEGAMQAYGFATSEAEAASYDDARLEVRLLAARTAIMRLEQLERGQDALDDVRGLLVRLDEPWPSSRRAEYDELQASLLKRKDQTGQALADQWLAILQYTLLGSVYERGLAYVNLGTIYERRALASESNREDLGQAVVSYEHALELLEPTRPSPAWVQATYNLGHLLVAHGGPDDWARAEPLLEPGRASGDDLRIGALTDLVLIRLHRHQAPAAEELARELFAVLREGKTGSLRMLFDAWIVVASTFAIAGDQAALETALVGVRKSTAALEKTGTHSLAETAISLAGLDLTAAFQLAEVEPARARAFALSAQERLLALPIEDRPADMMAGVDQFLAEGTD